MEVSVTRTRTSAMILAALFTALTAIGAFIKIPTPISSFTLQVLFVCMAGVFLGPKWGALSQAAYVALGLLGVPIFTGGGGIGYVLSPTFGFLLSYIPMAAVIGYMASRNSRPLGLVLACAAGEVVMYAIGLPYMAAVVNLYLGKAMSAVDVIWGGMIIFLPWDALKIVCTVLIASKLHPVLNKTRG